MTARIPTVLSWLRGAVLVLALVGALPARAAGPAPSLETLVKAFEVIAFGSEARAVKATGVLLKWDGPDIPFNMTEFKSAEEGGLKPLPPRTLWAGYAWRHMEALERLTGLHFTDSVATRKRPLLTIVFTPRKLLAKVPIPGVEPVLMQELAAPGGCYFLAFPGRLGVLERAFIVVNSEREPRDIEHCLLEELTQSLGLPNDTDLVRPSIFSDHDRLTSLSPTDEILVRTLYSKRLQPGMSRKAAMTTARLLIAQQLAALR